MKYADTYLKLADFGRELLNKKSLEDGMPLISRYAKDVILAARCSIFIYDTKTQKLWTTLSDGVEKIEVDVDKGIVGKTIKEKKPIVVNEAYSDPDFFNEIDKKTGYTTNNIITAPIFNSNRQVMGVLQLLNKEGGFDNEDRKFMIFFAHYVSGFLELLNHLKESK
jgi:signal transduction protein with GAF and PtsI domain